MSVEERHANDCATRRGKRCNCVAYYRGEVRDASGRKVRSAWSTSRAQALAWEQEATVAVRRGRLRASTPTTVKQAGAALVAGMRSGAILDRSGKPYKPKTVRTYEHALETYIYPVLGNRKVSTLRRADVQGFVEEMRALGAAPSTVHNRLDPLRVIVRRAIDNDELLVDPCARLKMPIVRNIRTRIEASTTAEALIAALPESEQAFWALALFAGLRRGELRALQVDDIDFEAGLVRVRRGWDDVEGEINPKTFAGARNIPMVGELRRICRAHKLQTGRHGHQLFLGRTPVDPFYPSTVRARALKAWGWKQTRQPEPRRPEDDLGQGPARRARAAHPARGAALCRQLHDRRRHGLEEDHRVPGAQRRAHHVQPIRQGRPGGSGAGRGAARRLLRAHPGQARNQPRSWGQNWGRA